MRDFMQPSRSVAVAEHGMAATSHPAATLAAVDILRAGGNAVDAAVAAVAVQCVVDPHSTGIGGDCFALVWDGKQVHGLNASGVAPAAWNVDYFRKKYGEQHGIAKQPVRGLDTVTVPGVIAGWEALHAKFGKLPFGDLMAPAIEIAERGHALAHIVARKWAAAVPELRDQPGYAQTFMPNGRAPTIRLANASRAIAIMQAGSKVQARRRRAAGGCGKVICRSVRAECR